jgi:subtilisin family serine protease
VAKGLLIVAAAGNAGPQSPPLYPAAYDGVIAVTALGPANDLYAQANRGIQIGLAAPGVDILSLKPKGGYDVQSGTSLAAAHVSGILALMLEKRPDATPRDVRLLLMGTALDLGPKGNDDQFGAGLVNARDAVEGITPAPETAAVVNAQ